jgi:hypothetical protein
LLVVVVVVAASAFLTEILQAIGQASLPLLRGSPSKQLAKDFHTTRLSELVYLFRTLLNSVPFDPTALVERAAKQAAALAFAEVA